MFSRSLNKLSAFFILFAAVNCSAADEQKPVLRIAAEPNNLPFSNDKCEGFENKIAQLIADELGMRIEYEWRAQRRGFFRQTLKEGNCDLVLSVPAGFDRTLNTIPYYRSSYVFVFRKDSGIQLHSFDDPIVKKIKVGVQLVGDDGTNTPPAHALSSRKITDNVVGFTIFGDYAEVSPAAKIVKAVAFGDVDVAVVWGPLAGFHAAQQNVPLQIEPVLPEKENNLPFTFKVCMGVRKKNVKLREELNRVIENKRDEIEKILNEYHVPLLPLTSTAPEKEHETSASIDDCCPRPH